MNFFGVMFIMVVYLSCLPILMIIDHDGNHAKCQAGGDQCSVMASYTVLTSYRNIAPWF